MHFSSFVINRNKDKDKDNIYNHALEIRNNRCIKYFLGKNFTEVAAKLIPKRILIYFCSLFLHSYGIA